MFRCLESSRHYPKPYQLYCCFSSVSKLCLTLFNPVDCSTPGFPVLPYLPRFAQTQVHWVDDAIQPSHPLLLPSPPAVNLSQHQGLFQWVGSSHQVTRKDHLYDLICSSALSCEVGITIPFVEEEINSVMINNFLKLMCQWWSWEPHLPDPLVSPCARGGRWESHTWSEYHRPTVPCAYIIFPFWPSMSNNWKDITARVVETVEGDDIFSAWPYFLSHSKSSACSSPFS